ncbi:MAG: hypothetical protein HXY40_01080 [Chloroflexi bacterium]|nr:hypothetical protein [Chloroflexota bacterium]
MSVYGRSHAGGAFRCGAAQACAALTESHRRELQIHRYRILGTLQDAEDIVQVILLWDWRRLETYAGPPHDPSR